MLAGIVIVGASFTAKGVVSKSRMSCAVRLVNDRGAAQSAYTCCEHVTRLQSIAGRSYEPLMRV
eukprot:4773888-Amphidinium_carterae.1